MLWNRRSFVLTMAAGIATAAEPARNPVVVELFTSEGCSSCPPADRILSAMAHGELAGDVPVIVLSEHVDYWDGGGWKDRFSQHTFTERQQWYATRFGGVGPYTPQMVVDGVVEFVGGDVRRALENIRNAQRTPKEAIQLALENGAVTASIQPAGEHGTADVYFALVENGLTTQVGGGENGGRTLRHDGVVRLWKHAGTWKEGQSFSGSFSPEIASGWNPNALGVVCIAQDRKTRRIIAAGTTKLHA